MSATATAVDRRRTGVNTRALLEGESAVFALFGCRSAGEGEEREDRRREEEGRKDTEDEHKRRDRSRLRTGTEPR